MKINPISRSAKAFKIGTHIEVKIYEVWPSILLAVVSLILATNAADVGPTLIDITGPADLVVMPTGSVAAIQKIGLF